MTVGESNKSFANFKKCGLNIQYSFSERRDKMKRIVILSIICLALVFQSVTYAEPYKSGKFPPENLLYKALSLHGFHGKGSLAVVIIGKFKESDNSYKIWFSFEKIRAGSVSLIKLDTNIWIFEGKTILQK